MNAVFLDMIDEDAIRLERLNSFLRDLSPEQRRGYRLVDLLVVRPSQHLGVIAAKFEPLLPRGFRFRIRGLGTQETSRPDLLTLLMFQPDYLRAVMELEEADAEARLDEIANLVSVETARRADVKPANVRP